MDAKQARLLTHQTVIDHYSAGRATVAVAAANKLGKLLAQHPLVQRTRLAIEQAIKQGAYTAEVEVASTEGAAVLQEHFTPLGYHVTGFLLDELAGKANAASGSKAVTISWA